MISKFVFYSLLIEDFNKYTETGKIRYLVEPTIYAIFIIIVIIVGVRKVIRKP